MLWLYIVLAQILLVNLLIAMMGQTYSKYSENAAQAVQYVTRIQ